MYWKRLKVQNILPNCGEGFMRMCIFGYYNEIIRKKNRSYEFY